MEMQILNPSSPNDQEGVGFFKTIPLIIYNIPCFKWQEKKYCRELCKMEPVL